MPTLIPYSQHSESTLQAHQQHSDRPNATCYLSKIAYLLSALIIALPYAYADYPITIEDDRRETVTFTEQPKSIVSISVFGADLVWALGQQATGLSTLNHRQSAYLGDQVKQMKDLGEVHETNMERLTELKPDLIIGLRQYTEPFSSKFEEIGKFLAFDLITQEDSDQAILTVTTALNQKQQGILLNKNFQSLKSNFNQQAPGGIRAILIWQWADTLYAFYNHSLAADIMKTLKVENMMGASPTPKLKKPDSSILSLERLLQLNPDVILSFTGNNAPISYHPVWQRLKAVQNNRAYRIDDQYIMPHGPVAREMVLREMAHLFYPNHFPAPDHIPDAARAKPLTFSER